jgi:hypothetical protein
LTGKSPFSIGVTRGKFSAMQSAQKSTSPVPELIRQGGGVVLNGEDHRQFPAPAAGFQKALTEIQSLAYRIRIYQRDGSVYADILNVTRSVP